MNKIGIVDYNIGNLHSVERACKEVNLDYIISNDPIELMNTDALILPGVGAFGSAMEKLKENHLDEVIIEFSKTGKFILGICLGMQLLVDGSHEDGYHSGLGLIKGKCVKFNFQNNKVKIPHIMWNKIHINVKNDSYKLFNSLPEDPFFYFVHSYIVDLENNENMLSTTNYENLNFNSSISKNNIIGVQFHPEKSGKYRKIFFSNFKNLIYNGE